MKILFTKSLEREKVSERLGADFSVDFVEVIKTEFIKTKSFGLKNNSLIFTSVNGVKAFFENEKMGYLIESLDPNEFAEKIALLSNNIDKTNQLLNRGLTNVVIAIVLAALIMASAVFLSLREPETLEIASSSFLIGLFSAVLLYRLLKKS